MITEQDNLCYCIFTWQCVKRHCVAGYLLLSNTNHTSLISGLKNSQVLVAVVDDCHFLHEQNLNQEWWKLFRSGSTSCITQLFIYKVIVKIKIGLNIMMLKFKIIWFSQICSLNVSFISSYQFLSNVCQFSIVCFVFMNMHKNGIIKVLYFHHNHQFFSLYQETKDNWFSIMTVVNTNRVL